MNNYWKFDKNGKCLNPVREQRFYTELCENGKYILMEKGAMGVHWPVRNINNEILWFDCWEQIKVVVDYYEAS